VTLHRKINADDLTELLRSIKGIVFTSVVNSGNDMANNQLLQSRGGFLLTDTNVQLRARVSMPAVSDWPGIRLGNFFTCDDALLRIADSVFVHSRMMNDPKMAGARSDSFYRWWLSLSADRDDKYLITHGDPEANAFLLFRASGDALVIELVGVAPGMSGRGIGTAMVARLNQYAVESGYSYLQTGTQLENIAALRFYQKIGFLVVRSSSIYHYWQ